MPAKNGRGTRNLPSGQTIATSDDLANGGCTFKREFTRKLLSSFGPETAAPSGAEAEIHVDQMLVCTGTAPLQDAFTLADRFADTRFFGILGALEGHGALEALSIQPFGEANLLGIALRFAYLPDATLLVM